MRFFTVCVLFSFAPVIQADETKVASIAVSNVQALRAKVGKEVTVVGKVTRIGKSSSGHEFLNFSANSGFSVVVRKENLAKFKAGPPSRLFNGKTVAIRGKIERYKGKLQIQVVAPSQISLSKAVAPSPKDQLPSPIKLTKLGKDHWKSPGGLIYRGRDPKGLTRVEHVLRHARDIPSRDGPHGVFSGGEKHALAWIDLAWKTVVTRKMKPSVEGFRETYTVLMKQPVGYLGGKTGKARRNPKLKRIFIVLRKGTREVITAFPK